MEYWVSFTFNNKCDNKNCCDSQLHARLLLLLIRGCIIGLIYDVMMMMLMSQCRAVSGNWERCVQWSSDLISCEVGIWIMGSSSDRYKVVSNHSDPRLALVGGGRGEGTHNGSNILLCYFEAGNLVAAKKTTFYNDQSFIQQHWQQSSDLVF